MDQAKIRVNDTDYTFQEADALAIAEHKRNNHVAAIAVYDQILTQFPNYAAGWSNRAVMLNLLQRKDEALASVEKALALKPGHAGFHSNRGDALRELGRYEEALASYDNALGLNPDNSGVHNCRAIALQAMGRYEEALISVDKAIALRHDAAEAHNNRGALLKQMRRYDEALASLNRAITLAPSNAESYNNRGTVLQELKRNEEALASYDQAIALQPGHARAYNNRGTVLQSMKRYDEALASYDQAIILNSSYAEAYSNRGDLLVNKGNMQEAEKAFTTALRLKPDLHRATRCLTDIHTYNDPDDEEIRKIRALLDNPNTQHTDKAYLYFSLGKIYDDCGRYDDAFTYYTQANQLVNSTLHCDRERITAFVDSHIAVFTKELFAQPRPFASDDASPLFIVGMPRSGTTLMASALSNHYAIDTAGELPTMTELVIRIPELLGGRVPYPQAVTHLTPNITTRLTQDYLKRLRRDASPAVLYVIDKQTLNFHHLGLIALLFPKARVIHCMRDPLDTCLSNYFQFFLLDYNYAFDLQNIGHFYKEYTRLMEHWRSVLPTKMIEVPYEHMVMDTKATVRNLLDCLGMEWDDSCLEPHTNPCTVETASSWQVRQPIYQHSVGRWRHYEKHLQVLKEMLNIT